MSKSLSREERKERKKKVKELPLSETNIRTLPYIREENFFVETVEIVV